MELARTQSSGHRFKEEERLTSSRGVATDGEGQAARRGQVRDSGSGRPVSELDQLRSEATRRGSGEQDQLLILQPRLFAPSLFHPLGCLSVSLDL